MHAAHVSPMGQAHAVCRSVSDRADIQIVNSEGSALPEGVTAAGTAQLSEQRLNRACDARWQLQEFSRC